MDRIVEKVDGRKRFKTENFYTVKEYLRYSTVKYKDLNAVIKKKDGVKYEIKYPEFENQVATLATGLYNILKKGEKVALLGKNSYEWTLLYTACLYAGIPAVPLDSGLQTKEIINSLERLSVKLIFTDNSTKEKTKEAVNIMNKKASRNIPEIYSFEEDVEQSISGLMRDAIRLPKSKMDEVINLKIDPYETKVYIFTSGTTDKSKIVMLSNRNIVSDILAIQTYNAFETDTTTIMVLPFHHVYGSTGSFYLLFSGVTLTYIDSLIKVGENIREYKPTQFFAVPAILELVYKKIEENIKKQGKYAQFKMGLFLSKTLRCFGIDIRRKIFKEILDALGGNLKWVMSGAAPMDKKLIKKYDDIGIGVLQGYGLTETSPCVIAEDMFLRKPRNSGKIIRRCRSKTSAMLMKKV